MKRKSILLTIILVISVSIVFSAVSAQSKYQIPSWVKGVAGFWAEGKISDSDFGEAITFLIEQGILKVEMPNTKENSELRIKVSQIESENAKLQKELRELKEQNSKLQNELNTIQKSSSSSTTKQGFSGLVCKKDYYGFVQLTGKYTNGDKAYSFLTIIFAIIGDKGEVLDTGTGIIQNIGPYETKAFSALSTYTGSFKSCEVQVEGGF